MRSDRLNHALPRRLGRWAAAVSVPLLTAGALIATPSMIASTLPSAGAYDCPDAEVIFARGTGEPKGVGKVGQAFIDSLRQRSPLNIDVYPVDYGAGRLQLNGGDGANDVIKRVKQAAEVCPKSQLVLGGYSQGASVISIVTGTQMAGITWGSSLSVQNANQVTAVVTFGNPADRTGGPISTRSPLFAGKAMDFCNVGDPICHQGPGNDWDDHVDGYVPGLTTQAAIFVASKLAIQARPTTSTTPAKPALR